MKLLTNGPLDMSKIPAVTMVMNAQGVFTVPTRRRSTRQSRKLPGIYGGYTFRARRGGSFRKRRSRRSFF